MGRGVMGEDAPVVLRERRHVPDLPPVRLRVTEHQALHVQCPACQVVSVGAFPTEMPSRAQYGPRPRALVVYLVEQQLVPDGHVREVLADLFGVHLSRGTLVAWVGQAAATLEPVLVQIKAALGQAPVLHSDETSVRHADHLAWAHVACTDRLTHYAAHVQRGSAATDGIGLFPTSTGVSVHDGWKPYQANTRCRHAHCNIHHLPARAHRCRGAVSAGMGRGSQAPAARHEGHRRTGPDAGTGSAPRHCA